MSVAYSRMRLGAAGENTRTHITRSVVNPAIIFDDADNSFEIGFVAEPPDRIIICDVVGNTITRSADGDEETFGPGDQYLIARPGMSYAGAGHASHVRLTMIDPAVLAHLAADDDAAEPIRLLDHRPVSRQAQLRLQRGIAVVRDTVMPVNDAPLIVSSAVNLLAAVVLSTYPNTLVSNPSQERRDAHPGTVRRAISFIEANADNELSLAAIARAAYVSPRALQLAFRRHLDTTPMAYLRQVRLSHAHDDLRTATGEGWDTVTSIAARWGFTSSQFSRRYEATYGQLPSRTLRATT
ncbi:helix-turn-helix transcriptional regulator [Amycolatopsis sp. NPDC089917]|uniref:helix-turn-helix transcriptional regulator n=1 Tax=Amycolatopsis sp. NPDC089917 TaxID=3155187 RepID=UPI003432DD20